MTIPSVPKDSIMPCEHCDSNDPEDLDCVNVVPRKTLWQVQCFCGLSGPYGRTEEEAISNWNNIMERMSSDTPPGWYND